MKFLCGCPREKLLAFGYKPRWDSDGFEICPSHGVREAGWRTKEALLKGRLNTAGGA